MEVKSQSHAPKEPRCILGRRMVGIQGWSGILTQQNSCPSWKLNPTVQPKP